MQNPPKFLEYFVPISRGLASGNLARLDKSETAGTSGSRTRRTNRGRPEGEVLVPRAFALGRHLVGPVTCRVHGDCRDFRQLSRVPGASNSPELHRATQGTKP